MNDKIVKALSKKLDPKWIKTLTIPGRPQLSYVSIDKTIKALNDAMGDDWNIEITSTEWVPIPNTPMVTITVAVSIKDGDNWVCRHGVGSDIHKPGRNNAPLDPDKLVKTAYASALKKATNMFGFAAELWDEDNLLENDSNPPVNNQPVNNQYVQQQPVQQQPVQQPQQSIQQQPVDQVQPTALSVDSKQKVTTFCQKTGLAKADLEDFLKEFNPASLGNPASLCHGDENANVDNFLKFVEGKLKQ